MTGGSDWPLGVDTLGLLYEAYDAAPDAILVLDRDARLRAANRAAVAMSGDAGLDALLGRTFCELPDVSAFHASQRSFFELIDALLREVMERDEAHADDDASRLAPDGSVVPVSIRMIPLRLAGQVIGVSFIIRDQTADDSLMFRQAAVGMVHVDRRGDVRDANVALLQLLGFEAGDLRGMDFLDLFHRDDRTAVAGITEPVLARRAHDGEAEVRLRRPDGRQRWVHLSVAPNGLGTRTSGGACAILQDVTDRVELQIELEQAQRRLRRLAMHDPLTGLANRARLADELAAAQQRAGDSGGHVAVLFIDLDGFKQVNDTDGHAAGDRLLVEAGERLRTLARDVDVAARFGGDEFVLCCADLDPDPEVAARQARRIAARVEEAMAEPFVTEGRQWLLGASVGVALSRGDEDPLDLLRSADAEMYRAKAVRH